MSPSPRRDAHDAQTEVIERLLPILERNEFSRLKLHGYVEELVAAFALVCADQAAQSAMVSELERWVRWHRLPAYWLTYLYQLAMQQNKSPFFIAGCRLYAEAQINFNEDLALSSLENGYNAAVQVQNLVTNGSLNVVVNDLRRRMRLVYSYYRRWYGSPQYSTVDQLTEHLYSELTWHDLASAFPALQKPWSQIGVEDLERTVDSSAAVSDTYHLVVARRFLGMLRSGKNELEAAEEQFHLALEAALAADLDTEIGHLYRLRGHVLLRAGAPDQAAQAFQRAVAHEAHPLCADWRALSARELGDGWMRSAPREINPRDPPPQLASALQAYRSGLSDFEAHVSAGVIPVARGIEQQMFRSYTDNAVQAAMLSNPRDTLAEIEGLGPRYATDMVAEGRAAALASPGSYATYRRARAIYGHDLLLFDLHNNTDADFAAYLTGVQQHRAERQTYLKTRLALTGPVAGAQFAVRNAQQLLALRLPDTVFLVFHVGAHQIVCCLVDAGSGQALSCVAQVDEGEWRGRHEAYRAAIAAAKMRPAPAIAMMQALDELLGFYAMTLGGLFETFLPFFKGKRLMIFP